MSDLIKLPPLWTVVALTITWRLNLVPVLQADAPFSGFPMSAVGVALVLWTILHFRRRETPIHPGKTPTALISDGPFRVNRNPIYTGFVMITLGYGISAGSLLGVLPAMVLFWALDRYHAAPEEARLLATFGADGEGFVANRRRW